MPRLVQRRACIEELKEELHREEEEYAADLKREPKNHREEIDIIFKRQEISLVSEARYVLTLQETTKANEERRKNSQTALETARDFGCGGNELDSTCALTVLIVEYYCTCTCSRSILVVPPRRGDPLPFLAPNYRYHVF